MIESFARCDLKKLARVCVCFLFTFPSIISFTFSLSRAVVDAVDEQEGGLRRAEGGKGVEVGVGHRGQGVQFADERGDRRQ
jgi:hypothetical protein